MSELAKVISKATKFKKDEDDFDDRQEYLLALAMSINDLKKKLYLESGLVYHHLHPNQLLEVPQTLLFSPFFLDH